MKQLQARVAIVPGASSGIGKAIAENFAAEGAKTVLVARRKEVLDGIVAEIRGKGGAAEAAAADVTKEADVDALFAKVVKAHGRGDIVVNNAGVVSLSEPSDSKLPPESVRIAILVPMYHEIEQPSALLYNLVPALKPEARVGIVDAFAPTSKHGPPPSLLRCELAAVGYREIRFDRLTGSDA